MKKFLRYTVRIAGGILCLLILVWLALAGYISVKKDTLLQKAKLEIRNRFGGDVHVGDWDISLFHNFPSITLHLSKVSLRDSLWQQHHHNILEAENVDVSLALFRSLMARKIRIGNVSVADGAVYFFTDSSGYSNKYLLRERPGGNSKAGKENSSDPPDVLLTRMRWTEEKQDRHKLFDIEIPRLFCRMRKDDRTLYMDVNAALKVRSLSFNTANGSFVKDKTIAGHFAVQYNTGSRILQFQRIKLAIDGHPFVFTGRFFPTVSPDPFFLDIETANSRFRELASLLTPALEKKLGAYDIDQPFNLQAILDAGSADDPMPLINIRMDLARGNVQTPAGHFDSASFHASFTNEWVRGQKREDENSGIRLFNFNGLKDNIGIHADTLNITNLKHPVLASDLHCRFQLAKLNDLAGSQSLKFLQGVCAADLRYKGPLSENDSSSTAITGVLSLDSASVEYLPYQLLLKNGNGKLVFRNHDLVIDHLEGQLGGTRVRLKGVAKNLATLLDRYDKDVALDLTLISSRLDIRDIISLVGRPADNTPKTTAPSSKNNQVAFGAVFSRIDRFLKEGDVHLRLEAADLRYKNFTGAHAKADLVFNSREIRLSDMQVDQGSGSLQLQATLTRPEGDASNPISLESHLNGVDLPKLFASFNDFGQDALESHNLKGLLTADIRMTGRLTNKAEMAPNSLKGTISFQIKNGQLLDFEPMEKINEKVLKKRDLSEIHFAELGSQMDLDSTTIKLHRMEIQSTALSVFVEGTYDLKKGPDLSLQVPLSNLKNRNPDIAPANKGNDGSMGLSVRLRARTGDDGKLKVSWDPFKKALKKK